MTPPARRMRVGFTSIANVDISKVVIDQMADKYRDKAGLTCASWAPRRRSSCHGRAFKSHERALAGGAGQKMNVCALDFPDETFDAILDKV